MGRNARQEYGTSEARTALPEIVKEAVAQTRPARSVGARAVTIRPRGETRSASLVPTIDLEAADARISALEAERQRLQDELEDAGIALLLHDRLAHTGDERVGAEAFLRAIGMEEFVDKPSDSGYEFTFLPEVADEAAQLPEDVRRALAAIIVQLHTNPWLGEELDDRPPRILRGCRKIRFDAQAHRGKPRYRLIYRNEPTDGAPGAMVVLAVGERRNMIAYAKAQTRHARRLREQAGEVTRRRER